MKFGLRTYPCDNVLFCLLKLLFYVLIVDM